MAIHIDVLADVNERSVRNAAANMHDRFEKAGQSAGKDFGNQFATGIDKSSTRIQKAMDKAADASGRLRVETAKLNELERDSTTNRSRLITQSERVAAARRRETAALRDAAKAMGDLDRSSRDVDRNFSRVGQGLDGLTDGIQDLGTSAMKTGRGLASVAAAPVLLGLVDLAKVAVTASQSIALLPAVAAAAGAGMGTLALATSGFADAIKDIRDPEKFATALAGLAPNAQQAALSIQNLLPQFDKLKAATQDAFFAGIGEEIHRLSTTYLPGIQQMTTSIATSFNDMMKGVSAQLMTPQTQAAMQTTFNNIAAMFQNLTPAAASLSQAFTDIMSTGSTFLPGLAQEAANLAREFANFIRNAQQSGQLREFIQNGIDAVKELASAVTDLGKLIYQIFGSDGKKNIEDFRDTVQGVSTVVQALSGDFSGLGTDIQEEFGQMTGAAAAFRDAILDIPEVAANVANAIIAAFEAAGNGVNNALNAIIPFGNPLPTVSIPRFTVGDYGGFTPPRAGAPPPGPAGRDIPTTPPPPGMKYVRMSSGNIATIPVGQALPVGATNVTPATPPAPVAPPAPYPGPFAVPAPPPPAAGGGGGGGATAPKFSDYGLQPAAAAANDIIGAMFPQITDIGGYRQDAKPFHPGGRALDIMIPGFNTPEGVALGNQINDFLRTNTAALGIESTIWQNTYRDLQGNVSTVVDHMNHIHAQFAEGAVPQAGALRVPSEGTGAPGGRPRQETVPVTVENFSGGAVSQLGDNLPAAFGLGEGLPGLAKYLLTFLADLAMAPVVGALSGVVQATGGEGAGGSGLVGIAASLGGYGRGGGGAGGAGLTGGLTGGLGGGAAPGGGTQAAVYNAMLQAGFPASEWPALQNLLQKESGFNPTARNPQSGAFGLFQFLGHENDKYGAMGGYSSDPATQAVAGLSYIRDRYGSPSAAWAHWQANNSYRRGGQVDSVPAMLTPGEHVLTTTDVAALGGQSGVYAFRQALHMQGGGTITGNVPFDPGRRGKKSKEPIPGIPGPNLKPGNVPGKIGLPEWGTPGTKFGEPPPGWWLKPINPGDVLFPEWMPPGMRDIWSDPFPRERIIGGFPRRPQHFQGGGAVGDAWKLAEIIGSNELEPGGPYTRTPGDIRVPSWGPGRKFGEPPGDWWLRPTYPDDLLPPDLWPHGPGGWWRVPGNGTTSPLGFQGGGAVGAQLRKLPGGQPSGPAGAQGGGFGGLGGAPMAAIQTGISAGSLALDAMAPGAGQAANAAAQIGIQLANRTAGYIGQLGGIAIEGLLETFSLSGSTPLTDPLKTLPGRLLAGFAGARPALPNVAGMATSASAEGPGGPAGIGGQLGGGIGGQLGGGIGGQLGGGIGSQLGGPGQPQRPQPWVNIENQTVNQGDGAAVGRDIARQARAYEIGSQFGKR